MFGIGLGEIALIFILIFLISPKEIPKALRKLGELFRIIDNIKIQALGLKEEIRNELADNDLKTAKSSYNEDPEGKSANDKIYGLKGKNPSGRKDTRKNASKKRPLKKTVKKKH